MIINNKLVGGEEACPICGNIENNSSFLVKEMQMGLREEFEYIECSNCGCLFLKEVPENIGKYYGKDYAPHNYSTAFKNSLLDNLKGKYISNNKLIKLFFNNKVNITLKFWNSLVEKNILNKNTSILDVGCGDGNFLKILRNGGFKDLTGIDLFIDENHIEDYIFDSLSEFIMDSEKYMRDISLIDEEWDTFKFSDETVKKFNEKIHYLNQNNDGDQAIFVLRLNG